jgi:hypothetical protein
MNDAYSVLALDQSMTATGWAHYLKGDKAPSGGLFPLPSWGDDQGPHIDAFARWLKDMLWDRQVTHLAFEEPVGELDHRETFTDKLAQWGLPTVIELVAFQGGIPADNRLLVNIATWRTRFWGRPRAPKELTKSARKRWLKERSIEACDERGWMIEPRNHNIADAMGVLNEALCCIDPLWASRDGPLFRRNQLKVENEERAAR